MRVSTFEQNESCQLEGLELDRVFTHKASDKDIMRPQLEAMLKFVREGDTVICHSMDRLGRNLVDLRRTVTDLTACKIGVPSLKRTLSCLAMTPHGHAAVEYDGAFAEFELAWSRERQREGIDVAKRAGVYKGRKRLLTPDRAAELGRRWPRRTHANIADNHRRTSRDNRVCRPNASPGTSTTMSPMRQAIIKLISTVGLPIITMPTPSAPVILTAGQACVSIKARH